jgi:F0F1-type ATP synthase assembly protein I
MNEQIVHMSPMWVLASLSAGWLSENFMHRRGYGLIVDMGLGVGASLVGGGVLLALAAFPAGMFVTLVIGFVLATSAIVVQRLCWPSEPGARERKARLWVAELGRPSRGAMGTVLGLAADGDGRTGRRPTPPRVLARLATTGIYLLRGVPIEVQRAARIRAAREGTTLRQVLLRSLGEYAAGTWTP